MTDERQNREDDENNDGGAENDTFEDANESTPRQSTSNNSKSKLGANVEQKVPDVSDDKEVDQFEVAEVLFSSEEAEQDKPNGQPGSVASFNTGVSRVLKAATEKLEQAKSNPSNNVEDSSAIISPPPESNDGTSQPAASKRKLFSWLSRNSSVDVGLKSPPSLNSRRGTASSVLSNEAADGSMTKLEEDAEGAEKIARMIHRTSLKDRFKLVRMREEAGIIALDDGDSAMVELGGIPQTSPDATSLVAVDSEEAHQSRRSRKFSTSGPMSPSGKPIINEGLAPGTAVGTLTGPSSDGEPPVDWDLWQEVVYEGPAAVARTSPDELSLATRRGIPSAIRGVVWQVLAQSKNEDLESMYTELVARGKERERRASELKATPFSSSQPLSRRASTVASRNTGNTDDKDTTNNEEHETDKRLENGDSQMNAASTHSSARSNSHTPSTILPDIGSVNPLQDASSVEETAIIDADALAEDQRLKDEGLALQKLERAIRRDLGSRTSFSKFLMSAGLQDGLFGICKAYALFDEEVGYAQGINFIAMPLLFNMPEEEAFCLFVRLMNKYRLRDLFIPEMPGLHLHLYQFERLLEDLEPAVYCHLNRRNVHPQLYATQWFLTLFAYRFPLQLVLRIYDLILSEGLEGAILKFGIVLMQKNAAKLLEMKDMGVLTTFLKEGLFDAYIDRSPSASSVLESGFFGSAGGIDKEVYRADALVEDACAANVTPEMLKAYTVEWEDKVRDEKDKAAAAEALRTSNTNLTQRVRELESRAEKLDQEHVQIASDLVHTKIANQTLSDENESLNTRITELQGIIEAQPAEVEARLRSEMERIMTRNAEVQHENRALEEQGAELEGELANVKLKYAEIASELDTMRKKWNSVSSMMSGVGRSS